MNWIRNLPYRIKMWWLWYTPPWSNKRVCPCCAGSKRVLNSYDWRDCELCGGTGRVWKLV